MIDLQRIRSLRKKITSDAKLRHDIKAMSSQVLALTIKELGANNGSFFLIEKNKITFQLLAYESSFVKVVEYKVKETMTKGLSAWAYHNRQGALSSDTRKDERWIELGDEGDEVHSAMAIPFIFFDEIIAIITLHHNTAQFFTELHLAIATEISNDLVGTLEAVRLNSQIEQQ